MIHKGNHVPFCTIEYFPENETFHILPKYYRKLIGKTVLIGLSRQISRPAEISAKFFWKHSALIPLPLSNTPNLQKNLFEPHQFYFKFSLLTPNP
jgi:hypothetical protein